MMKNLKLLPLLICLLLTFTSSAQKIAREYQHFIWNGVETSTKYEYSYATDGEKKEIITSNWDTTSASYLEFFKQENSYENTKIKNRTTSSWSVDESVWVPLIGFESFYDENTCLDKQIQTRWYPTGEVYETETVIIENEYNCSTEEWFANRNAHYLAAGYVLADTIIRTKTDSSDLQIFSFDTGPPPYGIGIVESGRQEAFFNAENQLVRYYNSFTDYQFAHLYLYEYDENGNTTNLEYLSKSSEFSSWDKQFEIKTTYLYEGDILIKKVVTKETPVWNSPPDTEAYTIDYEYYCDDIIKKESWTNEDGELTKYIIYEYNSLPDCLGYEDSILLNAYPNPTTEKVSIECNLFNKGEAVIKLYTITGELIYSKAIKEQTSQVDLDLEGYSSSILILRVQTAEKQISTMLKLD